MNLTGKPIQTAIAFVAILWLIECVDVIFSLLSFWHVDIDKLGIRPRTFFGFIRIPFAPFFHSGLGHLISNSISLLILIPLVVISRAEKFPKISLCIILVSGLGAWWFGSGSLHIGASGLIYGYVGFLLAQVFVTRKASHFLIALIVGALYGLSLLFSLIPKQGISWSMHWWGFLGGVLVSFALAISGSSVVKN